MFNTFPPNKCVQLSPIEVSLKEHKEKFQQFVEPTSEELEYVFTNDELKMLCRHYDVKVDMTKFNDLYHFYEIFKKRGSLKNRSKEFILRLLLRTCRHYKNDLRHAYSEQEITEILQEEWEVRKTQTVRYLKQQNSNSSKEETVAESFSSQVSQISK